MSLENEGEGAGTSAGADDFDMAGAVSEIASEMGVDSDTAGDGSPVGSSSDTPVIDAPGAEPTSGDPSPEIEGAAPAFPTPVEGPELPPSYSPTLKDAWAQTPKEVREAALKREQDFHNGIEQYKGAAEALRGIVEPFKGVFERAGAPPQVLIPQMLQAYAAMAYGPPETKVQLFHALARDAGIDVTKLAEGGTAAAQTELAQAMQEIRNLRTGLTNVGSQIAAQRSKEQEQAVLAFANDEAAHPHFWDVAENMMHIFQVEPNLTLEAAYEKAVWTNPVTRAKEVARQVKEQADAAQKAAREKAAASKKATAANVTAAGVSRPKAAPKSLDQTLSDAYDAITSRGAA